MELLIIFVAGAFGSILGHFIGAWAAFRYIKNYEETKKREVENYYFTQKLQFETFVKDQKELLTKELVEKQQKAVEDTNNKIQEDLNKIFKNNKPKPKGDN